MRHPDLLSLSSRFAFFVKLIFFFLPTVCLQAAGEKPFQPNIILILADDVSADELSPYGGAISMPNLQKLADEGVLFRNTWATPVCAPSRAMLMTGKYPHHTGYCENPVAPEVPFWRDPRHLPVLKMMKEAGYATSMVGKITPEIVTMLACWGRKIG